MGVTLRKVTPFEINNRDDSWLSVNGTYLIPNGTGSTVKLPKISIKRIYWWADGSDNVALLFNQEDYPDYLGGFLISGNGRILVDDEADSIIQLAKVDDYNRFNFEFLSEKKKVQIHLIRAERV